MTLLNKAPVVYVPTEPEGNGLTLPTLLSVLAHGLVIGLLIYSYYLDTDTPERIETVMVSPEQLAAMQEQVLANRAAMASTENVSTASDQPANTSTPETTQNAIESDNSQSVFTRSNEPASGPLLMSEAHQERLAAQNREYERNIADIAEQLDQEILAERSQLNQSQREDAAAERQRLQELRDKRSNPPRIVPPKRGEGNIKITSDNSPKNLSLGDGEPTASSNNSSRSSRSVGEFRNAIAEKILRYLQAPDNTQGTTARVLLNLDTRGNVISATATGSNPKVNSAAEAAAFAASPLPIDSSNPSAFKEIAINITVE